MPVRTPVFIFLTALFLALSSAGVKAQMPYPQTPPHPPVVQQVDSSRIQPRLTGAPIDGHGLKAVLLVGPIDGDTGL
jgi:hypothetical protein